METRLISAPIWPFQFDFVSLHKSFAYVLSVLNKRCDVFITPLLVLTFTHADVARELIAFEWLQKHFICTVSLRELRPRGVSAWCCITTVDLETRLSKHGEFSREPKLHPSAKLAERWETNKITDDGSWGSGGGGWALDTGVIFSQFYSADAQMSDADVFSDSRAKTFQKWVDWMKEEPPGLIGSPRTCLTRQSFSHCLTTQLEAAPWVDCCKFPQLDDVPFHWHQSSMKQCRQQFPQLCTQMLILESPNKNGRKNS